jgi:2-polyprenyl-6-methoxyphenol hydroxylase-like FAD-dependent oxidoreductase
MTTTPHSPTILLIGGGLGGLALAQRLTAAGLRAIVFERDAGPTARAQGYRISLNDLGLGALRALLPSDRFAALAAIEAAGVGRDFHFATGRHTPLLRFRSGRGVGAITVSRGRLRRLLAEGLDVRWNQRLVGFRDERDGVVAELADGTTVRGDLLVGCDGAGSDVRALLHARGGYRVPELIATHLVSLGAVVPRTPAYAAALPLLADGAVQHFGPAGLAMFVSACEGDDGRPLLLWVLSRRDPAWTGADRAALLADCIARVDGDGWHPALRRLVRETPADALIDPIVLRATRHRRGRRRRPLWASGRVTLLGDAAHTMPPQRGIGGNHAFEDARQLAARLVDAAARATPVAIDWPRLALGYERELFARGRAAVEESTETADLCHFRHPLLVALRDRVLRVVDRVAAWRLKTANSAAGTPDFPRLS